LPIVDGKQVGLEAEPRQSTAQVSFLWGTSKAIAVNQQQLSIGHFGDSPLAREAWPTIDEPELDS